MTVTVNSTIQYHIRTTVMNLQN